MNLKHLYQYAGKIKTDPLTFMHVYYFSTIF